MMRRKFFLFSSQNVGVSSTIPDAPNSLIASLSATNPETEIELNWTIGNDGGSAITGFKIQRENPIGGGWATIVSDTGNQNTTYTDTGLVAGQEYNYRVVAINVIGDSLPSNESNITTSSVIHSLYKRITTSDDTYITIPYKASTQPSGQYSFRFRIILPNNIAYRPIANYKYAGGKLQGIYLNIDSQNVFSINIFDEINQGATNKNSLKIRYTIPTVNTSFSTFVITIDETISTNKAKLIGNTAACDIKLYQNGIEVQPIDMTGWAAGGIIRDGQNPYNPSLNGGSLGSGLGWNFFRDYSPSSGTCGEYGSFEFIDRILNSNEIANQSLTSIDSYSNRLSIIPKQASNQITYYSNGIEYNDLTIIRPQDLVSALI